MYDLTNSGDALRKHAQDNRTTDRLPHVSLQLKTSFSSFHLIARVTIRSDKWTDVSRSRLKKQSILFIQDYPSSHSGHRLIDVFKHCLPLT